MEIKQGPVGDHVADNVRRLRKERQLSLDDLSKRLAHVGRPISLKVLSRIENKDRGIDVDDLVALSAALAVPPSRLLMAPSMAAREQVAPLLNEFRARMHELISTKERLGAELIRIRTAILDLLGTEDEAVAAFDDYWASAGIPEEVRDVYLEMFPHHAAAAR